MHLVVARYNEDISWVHNLNVPFTIYNKGEDNIQGYEYIKRENEGRESETYLRYILDNYYKLPEHICFLQGDPFPHCPDLIQKFTLYDYSPLYFFGRELIGNYEDGTPDHPGLSIKKIAEDLGIYTGKFKYYFVPGAQFIASKQVIQSRSLEWWSKAYEIHNKYPDSPWVYERLWGDIFLA